MSIIPSTQLILVQYAVVRIHVRQRKEAVSKGAASFETASSVMLINPDFIRQMEE